MTKTNRDMVAEIKHQMLLRLASRLEVHMWNNYQVYLEVCAEDRKAGYRPHVCEHGMSLWTDYDNICGPCEDGRTMADGLQRRSEALYWAHERWDEASRLITWLNQAESLRVDLTDEQKEKVYSRYRELLMLNEADAKKVFSYA